jgi:hypothetical protein
VKISFRFPQTLSDHATRRYRSHSVLFCCAFIAVLPLVWRGTSCGHDFDFHLQSWLETAQHWREGVFYPHWDASANYGAGEPRFVFYPPATWMLGALLGTIFPWNWVPAAFTFLAFLASGASFCKMARAWMPEHAATAAACIYVLNPYLLFVAYERTAYGELLSAALFPLLVVYGLQKETGLLPLASIIAALWLTNAPSAVMGSYFLALITILSALRSSSLEYVVRSTKAFLLGIGLAAFYIVPAYYEQRWVEISRAIGPGMRVEDSFLFEHTGAVFHDQVLRSASWIAVAMLTATFIAAWLSLKSDRTFCSQKDLLFPQMENRTLWLVMTSSATVILLLLLPFSRFLWYHLPELVFLQFPWRWLLVLGVAMCTLIGLAFRGHLQEAGTRRSILTPSLLVILTAAILSFLAAKVFWQPCDEEDNVAAQRMALQYDGFEGTDEYTTAGTDNSSIQRHRPLVETVHAADAEQGESGNTENPEWQPESQQSIPARIKILNWQTENKTIEITTKTPADALLRLVDYPAWRVTLNGKLSTKRPHREDGLMVLPLPSGKSVISIRYTATTDVKLGRIFSLLALGIAILLFLRTKKQRELRV